MQENPTQLQRIVAGFGWDLEEAIAAGMLTLMYMSPVGTYIDEFVSARSRKTALLAGAQRVLIDSLNDLQAAADEEPLPRLHVLARPAPGGQRRLDRS